MHRSLPRRARPAPPRSARSRPVQAAKGAPGPSLLEDERFAAMFSDPAFTIDERSDEWRQLHPNTGGRAGAGQLRGRGSRGSHESHSRKLGRAAAS